MNYYQILGLESTVNDLEIKSAYRRLAMLYHPDRINGDDIKFKLVNEAYKILSSEEKRKEYDINNNINRVKINTTQNQYNITAPYDSTLNVFNDNLKEIFVIIKEGTTRNLKQTLGMMKNVSLENHYYQKYTPLMEAVYLQRLDMVEFITKEIKEKYTRNNIVQVKYQRYLNQINVEGKTALIIASLSNTNADIMKYLIKQGSEISIRDKEEKSIFEYAYFSQSEEIEDFILSFKK